MKLVFTVIFINALCAYVWAKENHHIVSKVTDHYTQSEKGEFILSQSTYLVGYFKQGESGMPEGILTQAKTVDYKALQKETRDRRLEEILKMAGQISGQKFENSTKKVSEEVCLNDKTSKNCDISIELSL